MTKEQILEAKKFRFQKLSNSTKNVEGQGVLRKLEREVRNLKKGLDKD